MVFKYVNATEPLRGDSLLFTTKFPETSGTHLIDHTRMKDQVDCKKLTSSLTAFLKYCKEIANLLFLLI